MKILTVKCNLCDNMLEVEIDPTKDERAGFICWPCTEQITMDMIIEIAEKKLELQQERVERELTNDKYYKEV